MAEETAHIEPPQAQATEVFDFQSWKAKQNGGATESASGAGAKPGVAAEAKPAAVEPPEGKGEGEGDHTPNLPRSVRREINRLREEAAEARGRLAAMKEFQDAGKAATTAQTEAARSQLAANAEPTREGFTTDAEYYKALAKWEVKQELAQERASTAQGAQQQAFMDSVTASTTKFEADVKAFEDWETVVDAMHDIEIDVAKQETFIGLLATSDQRAAVLYHLAKNPDARSALFAMSPDRQIAAFHRLEGKLDKPAAEKPPEKAKPTTAVLDAKKAKPSAAVGAKGGTPTDGAPSMTLADGVTINPAWKAAQAARNGLRP